MATPRQYIPEANVPEYAPMKWEPDWWSRLMAVGSMLVAAAALYYARYPDTASPLSTAGLGTGTVVSTDDANSGSMGAPATVEAADDEPSAEEAAAADEQTMESVASAGPASGSRVSPMAHAIANADQPSATLADLAGDADETTVLRVNSETESMQPEDESEESALEAFAASADSDDSETASSSEHDDYRDMDSSNEVADSAPSLSGEMIKLDGNTESPDKLLVEFLETQPLKSEYAITMTVRNTSDRMVVINSVLFQPREIIENVSTEFAGRSFGVSSPSEFVLSLKADDNLAKKSDEIGRYAHRLDETFQVPGKSSIDIRLAVENPEHIGYGLIGKLTLEYNVDESLNVENTAIAFIDEQDE